MPEFDFGHFHIIDELGRGGMALVYRAVDTRTDDTVALKILYPHLMSDEKTIKRFQREARVASRLKHKYIVPVIDFGEHEKQIYIAMRYMSGNSLADLFGEPRSIRLKNLIRILGEVASALDYAHQEGVIHRDLKLQNILMDENHHAYLSDFGIARLVDGTRLTATGQVAGTPMYMSPEQIRGREVDFRSDIYSFSVMAYLLLTGYYPFTGEDSLAIIHKHVKEYPPTPTEVNPDLPEMIDSVLLRGLMKDPKDRYESTLEMVKALHNAVNTTPDYHKTTTRIDIHAVNPIDSVEVDAVPAIEEHGVQSPAASGQTSQELNTSDIQSNIFTDVLRTSQTEGSRSGIFALFFGIVAISTVVIAIALIVMAIQESNEHNFTVGRTEKYLEFNTSTKMCDEILLIYDEFGTQREREVEDNKDCSGTIMQGVVVQSKPGPVDDPVETLSEDATIYLVARDEFNRYVQILTLQDNYGWIPVEIVISDIAISELPYFPPAEGLPDQAGESSPQNVPPKEGNGRRNGGGGNGEGGNGNP